MPINILDATGTPVAIPTPNGNGQQTMAGSRPVTIASDQSGVNTIPANITTKFREAFEVLDPAKWNVTTAAGDIIKVDGNTAAASYLMISKSPYNAGTESLVETIANFSMPIELAFGAHMSQRTLGQEFSVELVDTGTPLPDIPDLAISSISQSATVLTVDTVAPHGLTVGKSIGITGCSNQLVNFPALVVASIPSPTQFTATAGPGGTLISQTVANPGGAKGSVFFRERLGRAQNGASQIFEQASSVQASAYVRSESGDALPSGTIAGSHSITVGATTSVQLANAAFSYAFAPTTEYRLTAQADRLQWSDAAVDSVAASSARLMRNQVCPDSSEMYKLRIRATNNKSLSVLGAKVVSTTKSGSTTATFVTATPHGLVTGDVIMYYGNSNNTAATFPNVTSGAPVTVVDATTFTMANGSGTTGTGYGGVISKNLGNNPISNLGANNNSVSAAVLTTDASGVRNLNLTAPSAWSSLAIGDYVELAGCSNVTNGALLGVDGTWKVASLATTVMTLVPATAAVASGLPANFGNTTCGGAVVKRTCFRLSFVRIFDFERHRVEILARPNGDAAAAAPVNVMGGSVAAALNAGTNVIGIARLPAPNVVNDIPTAAITTTATTAAFTPGSGTEYEVNIPVTAVSGTNPTMDVVVQESDDSGANWFDVYHFPRITATGIYRSPKLVLKGNRVRYVQTIGGTSPSFTRPLNRVEGYSSPPRVFRRFFDRTFNTTQTTGNVTSAYNIQDCEKIQVTVHASAQGTTAPQFSIQVSNDGIQWTSYGSNIVAVTGVGVTSPLIIGSFEFIRVNCQVTGVGATLNWVEIKAW